MTREEIINKISEIKAEMVIAGLQISNKKRRINELRTEIIEREKDVRDMKEEIEDLEKDLKVTPDKVYKTLNDECNMGLNNKKCIAPYVKCALHNCMLSYEDVRKRKCVMKMCVHMIDIT